MKNKLKKKSQWCIDIDIDTDTGIDNDMYDSNYLCAYTCVYRIYMWDMYDMIYVMEEEAYLLRQMTSADDDDDEEVEDGAGAADEPVFDFFMFEFIESDIVDPGVIVGAVVGAVGASRSPWDFLFFLFPIGRKKGERERMTFGGRCFFLLFFFFSFSVWPFQLRSIQQCPDKICEVTFTEVIIGNLFFFFLTTPPF